MMLIFFTTLYDVELNATLYILLVGFINLLLDLYLLFYVLLQVTSPVTVF